MNLGPGFASGFADALPEAELRWQRVLAGRQQQQEQQRQQQAAAAFMRSLLSQPEAALPQQGPPGMMQAQQAPAAQSPQLPASLPTGDAGASVPGPVSPPSPPAPGPTAGRPGFTPPDAGGRSSAALQFPDPAVRLRQMAQRLKAANPGLDDVTLATALGKQIEMMKGMGAEDRALLQAETRVMQIQAQSENAIRRADNAIAIAEIRASGAKEIADARLQAYRDVAGQRSFDTRRGQDLQHQDRQDRLQMAKDQAASGQLDPTTREFMGQSLRAGNLQQVNEVLGYARNRAAIMGQIIQEAKRQDPSFDGAKAAGALARMGAMKTGANVVARTAANVAVGAAELPVISQKIDEASKHLNLSRYPNINALQQAYQRRAGTPEEQEWLQKFVSYIQTARNAYNQIAARGGRMSDKVRGYGEELINGTMAPATLKGALEAFGVEGGVVKGAAGAAMDDVVGAPGTEPTGGGAPLPGAVEEGYRFKGGDPGDPNSWEQVR